MTLNHNIKSKIYQYFVENMGMYDYRRGWLKGDCPSCGEHKFGIHIATNRTNCFKCTYHIKPLELIMEIEGINTYYKLKSILDNLEGRKYVEPILEPYELKKNTVLPESYRNIRSGNSVFSRSARKYLKNRGFEIIELSKMGWGYCTNGKYQGYIIMPFYVNNKLIYFNARRFLGSGPKFNNPDIEDFGLGKSMIIYNVDALYMYRKCFLFESVTNCATIGKQAIGTGGKKISNYQMNIIIKSPCEKIIIGLDEDAIDDAIDVGIKLVNFKKIKIMLFPQNKDVNDLGRNKSLNIARKSKYLNYNDLMSMRQ